VGDVRAVMGIVTVAPPVGEEGEPITMGELGEVCSLVVGGTSLYRQYVWGPGRVVGANVAPLAVLGEGCERCRTGSARAGTWSGRVWGRKRATGFEPATFSLEAAPGAPRRLADMP
jgi:hypothetical protein